MSEKESTYTLWTITRDSWSDFLADAQLTAEVTDQIEQTSRKLVGFEKRLDPYNTPVTEETLRQSVK